MITIIISTAVIAYMAIGFAYIFLNLIEWDNANNTKQADAIMTISILFVSVCTCALGVPLLIKDIYDEVQSG